MLGKIIKELFTMRMIALGLLIFLVAIAKATFIESDFGTPASKIAIYNTRWFELLLVYLSIGLIVNMFRYRMFQKEKAAMFAFHLSFLVIIIGAALTRYVGFEGSMPINEGQTSNIIFSSNPYLTIKANDGVNMFDYEEQRWLSEGKENPFSIDFQLPDQAPVNIEYVSYLENFIDTLITADSIDSKALEFVIQGETKHVFEEEFMQIGSLPLTFSKENTQPGIQVWEENKTLYIQSIKDFRIVDMMKLNKEDRARNFLDTNAVDVIPADTAVPFYSGRLYMFEGESVMFKELRRNITRGRIKAKQRDEGTHYLTIQLSSGEKTKTVELTGNHDRIVDPTFFSFNGLNYEVAYGALPIELPFSILCKDFQLDRYPGSDMASSFASEVRVIDEVNKLQFDKRIFMNNVMDYQGYRFFQSSYFPDESGTVLSVNYDWWGTNVTYLGYLLMTIGMFLSLFAPSGRFIQLNQLIKKSRKNRSKMKMIPLLLMIGISSFSFAHQDHAHEHEHKHEHEPSEVAPEPEKFEKKELNFNYITVEESKEIADLLVQDYDGRVIPFHTLSDRILRKVYQDNSYHGKNPVQVVIAFHLYGPSYWMDKELLFVSNKIRGQLGVEKYISVSDAEDMHGNFKWAEDYNNAFEKPDSKKTEYDKKLIKLGERYRVMKEVFSFQHFRVVPIPDDPNGTWVWPFSIDLKDKENTGNQLATDFLRNLYDVTQGNASFSKAEEPLEQLKEYQWRKLETHRLQHPSAELPTKQQINAEITYNEINPFNRIKNWYFIIGMALLVLFFFKTVTPLSEKKERIFKWIARPATIFIFLIFILHGIGLGFRWYISGHAPWSNGYEAVIFIAWSTVLAGFFFSRKNPAVIPATALLAGMMLFVTELNLLDPEITPLQPVLKSYWLMIHVAIITSSYGFLGLSAILAIVNMTLYIFRNQKNKKFLSMNINELTAVSEMTMTIGLFMLTIGTFLGGIWANESWGRYWGWDPKETWALVSVLTYAIILHLRYIPKLSDRFIFNFVSLWGYSSILFTFFGVNFKLVGLHSYAQGEGVAETPSWVWWTIAIFALFTVFSLVRYLMVKFNK